MSSHWKVTPIKQLVVQHASLQLRLPVFPNSAQIILKHLKMHNAKD